MHRVRMLCMYSMYVFYVCIICMYYMYAFYVSIQFEWGWMGKAVDGVMGMVNTR